MPAIKTYRSLILLMDAVSDEVHARFHMDVVAVGPGFGIDPLVTRNGRFYLHDGRKAVPRQWGHLPVQYVTIYREVPQPFDLSAEKQCGED